MGVSLSHIGEERVKELEKKPRLTDSAILIEQAWLIKD